MLASDVVLLRSDTASVSHQSCLSHLILGPDAAIVASCPWAQSYLMKPNCLWPSACKARLLPSDLLMTNKTILAYGRWSCLLLSLIQFIAMRCIDATSLRFTFAAQAIGSIDLQSVRDCPCNCISLPRFFALCVSWCCFLRFCFLVK